MIKNPNWQKANHVAIYKHGQGFEHGTIENKSSEWPEAGHKLRTSRLLFQSSKDSSTLPPVSVFEEALLGSLRKETRTREFYTVITA